jgi:hypothetical protein
VAGLVEGASHEPSEGDGPVAVDLVADCLDQRGVFADSLGIRQRLDAVAGHGVLVAAHVGDRIGAAAREHEAGP